MKIAVNRWTMPPDWTLAECFQAAARTGFEGVEINLAEEGELTRETSDEAAQAIAESAAAAGVSITSVLTGLGWKYPMTSPDPTVRAQAADNVRCALWKARSMGVDAILCVPGRVDADIPYDAAYDRARGALRDLAPEAAEARVSIAVENVWNKFLLSPLEMARFLDEIGSDWVGAYFDVGNVLVYGYPHHWIHILGSRIRRVHVKDFRTNIGNITGFCNPLMGDVPWEAVRDALGDVGYDGWITAEVDGYRIHPEVGLRHIAESLSAVFQ